MNIYSLLSSTILNYCYFWGWRDIVEILFFSSLVYYFSLWLKKNRQKNLLGYFYCYCLIAAIANYAQLTTITSVLIWSAPITAVLFIMLHQETLQRNFISLQRKKTTAPQTEHYWIEELIRSCLQTLNRNQEITCVIEHTDTLDNFLTTPVALDAELDKKLLTILIESNTFDSTKMVWLNTAGKLLGINATWNHMLDELFVADNVRTLPKWQQDALLITTKTDALIFNANPVTRTFDIVIHGNLLEQVTTNNTIKVITKYLTGTSQTNKKGIYYGSHTKKRSVEQPNP